MGLKEMGLKEISRNLEKLVDNAVDTREKLKELIEELTDDEKKCIESLILYRSVYLVEFGKAPDEGQLKKMLEKMFEKFNGHSRKKITKYVNVYFGKTII